MKWMVKGWTLLSWTSCKPELLHFSFWILMDHHWICQLQPLQFLEEELRHSIQEMQPLPKKHLLPYFSCQNMINLVKKINTISDHSLPMLCCNSQLEAVNSQLLNWPQQLPMKLSTKESWLTSSKHFSTNGNVVTTLF